MEQSVTGRGFRQGKLGPDFQFTVVVTLLYRLGLVALELCLVDVAVAGKIQHLLVTVRVY